MRIQTVKYHELEININKSNVKELDAIRESLNIEMKNIPAWVSFPMFACDILSFIGFVIIQVFLWRDVFFIAGLDAVKVFSGVVFSIGLYCLLKTVSIFLLRRGMSLGLILYCWLLNVVIIILASYFFISLPFFRSIIPGIEGSIVYSTCSLVFVLVGKSFLYTLRFDKFMLNNFYELTWRREKKIS